MLSLLLVAAALYGAVVLLAAAFQGRLLFPTFAVGSAGSLPPTAERLVTTSAAGDRLEGIHFPSTSPAGRRILVVVFGGNAWNAQDAGELVHHLWPQADVVAFHYRGYAPSAGKPSAAGLLADAPLIIAAARKQVSAARTIAVGFSIGSGVAASLAAQGRVDGAVLVTPFDSLRAVARGHYPWLPVPLLFRHDMGPAAALQRSSVPIALISAERDTIIPPARTATLRKSVRQLAYDHVVPGAGHNDIYSRSDFQRAMDEAFEAVLQGKR